MTRHCWRVWAYEECRRGKVMKRTRINTEGLNRSIQIFTLADGNYSPPWGRFLFRMPLWRCNYRSYIRYFPQTQRYPPLPSLFICSQRSITLVFTPQPSVLAISYCCIPPGSTRCSHINLWRDPRSLSLSTTTSFYAILYIPNHATTKLNDRIRRSFPTVVLQTHPHAFRPICCRNSYVTSADCLNAHTTMHGQSRFLTCVVHSLHHVAQSPSFRDRSCPVRLLNPHDVSRHLENYILSVLPSFVEALPAEIGTPSPQGTFSSQPTSAPIAYSVLVC